MSVFMVLPLNSLRQYFRDMQLAARGLTGQRGRDRVREERLYPARGKSCSVVRSARSSFSRFLRVFVTKAGGPPEGAGACIGALSASTGRMELSAARRVGKR